MSNENLDIDLLEKDTYSKNCLTPRRLCIVCNENKELSDFPKSLAVVCKSCYRKANTRKRIFYSKRSNIGKIHSEKRQITQLKSIKLDLDSTVVKSSERASSIRINPLITRIGKKNILEIIED